MIRTVGKYLRHLLKEPPGAPEAGPSLGRAPSQLRSPLRRTQRFRHSVKYQRTVVVENQAQSAQALETPGTIAIVAGGSTAKWVQFKCPCGCGDVLRVSLQPAIRPTWRLRVDRQGRVSLYPSVDRTNGCRAHFLLMNSVARVI